MGRKVHSDWHGFTCVLLNVVGFIRVRVGSPVGVRFIRDRASSLGRT